MRAFLPLLVFFLAGPSLQAQTYYYVNALEVIPEEPTSDDEVSVHVFGDYSDTGSYITGHSVELVGNTVQLTIDCASGAGFTVITPFDTIFSLGNGFLPGDYSIELDGTGLGDFVGDPNDYDFTVQGANGMQEQIQESLTWTLQGEQMLITNAWHQAIELTMYDTHGRLMIEPQRISTGSQILELPDFKGLVLLSFEVDGIVWGAKLVDPKLGR